MCISCKVIVSFYIVIMKAHPGAKIIIEIIVN